LKQVYDLFKWSKLHEIAASCVGDTQKEKAIDDIGDVVKNFQNSAKSFRNILSMMTDYRERALSLTSLTLRDYSQNLQLELSALPNKLENIRYFSKSNIEKFSQSYKLLMNVLKDSKFE